MDDEKVWDEKYRPVPAYNATVYTLQFSRDAVRELNGEDCPFIHVSVDMFGMLSIIRYSWFGEYSTKGHKWSVAREILDWMVEWDLAQMRQISPDESDWFATEKLLSTPQENYWFELMETPK